MRQLQSVDTVIFHCALSQQRGPSAALRYIRERERLLPKTTGSDTASDKAAGPDTQTVLVLDRGFVGWQEVYGEDERLTEGYRKELWGRWLLKSHIPWRPGSIRMAGDAGPRFSAYRKIVSKLSSLFNDKAWRHWHRRFEYHKTV